ncbi:MAG: cyclic nucleotide-binding domain-containing protein [Bdellovibrionales bacterium]|nr:cyclic nucleotide-binding domain-containing protein [Bdellovibrionales bacterium]
MYILDKLPEEIEQHAAQAKAKINELLPHLAELRRTVTLSAGSSLYRSPEHDGKLYVLREGVLKFIQGEKLLYYCDEGDLVGYELLFSNSSSALLAEFAVKLDEYDAETFFSVVGASVPLTRLWHEYTANVLAWTSSLVRLFSRDEAVFSPSIMLFQAGDVMVEQGSHGDEVFTLMEGKASVLVDGVEVGEILEEEMFGAVALLTDKPRLASVVAATDCMVVRLSKEEFVNLVQSRPDTIFKLASDLSRAIMALNDQVAKRDIV